MDAELKRLDQLVWFVVAYLLLLSLVGFFAGYHWLGATEKMIGLLAVSLIGFAGSGFAALTSCLDRYARGFERENGTKVPKLAQGETFNRRMARWFLVRPFLGAVVAPLFLWGIVFFTSEPKRFLDSPEHVAFSAFMGGLLAKSVLDLIKNLFKSVFRA